MASCLEVRRLVELVQFAGMHSGARAGRSVIEIKLSLSSIVNFSRQPSLYCAVTFLIGKEKRPIVSAVIAEYIWHCVEQFVHKIKERTALLASITEYE